MEHQALFSMQRIHMKNQALFSSKDKSEKNKVLSAANFVWHFQGQMLPHISAAISTDIDSIAYAYSATRIRLFNLLHSERLELQSFGCSECNRVNLINIFIIKIQFDLSQGVTLLRHHHFFCSHFFGGP